MTKHEIRELFFKSIFMWEFSADEEEEVYKIQTFLDSEEKGESAESFIKRAKELISHLEEIDGIINNLAEGWKTSRIAKVDLAILRVAIFEMKYENLEKGIAINEAVELAKEYGEDKSYAFINGILGRV